MEQRFGISHSQKKNRQYRIKLYFSAAGIILFCVGVFYLIDESPVFKIRDFHISGQNHFSDNDIVRMLEPLVLTTRFKVFLGKGNMLSWNVRRPDISKTALATASIDRDWIRQSVNIAISEREQTAIWCDAKNDCNWIDGSGLLYEKAPRAEGALIPIVYDINAEYLARGSYISEPRFIGNIIAILKGIRDLRLPVEEIKFDSKLDEIRIATYAGPNIYFSIRFDPSTNMHSLKSLMEKPDFKKYGYADLRVENRVYLK